LRRGGFEIADGPPANDLKEWRFMRASFEQRVINSDALSLGCSPRRDPFAADSLGELRFALDHQYAYSVLSENLG